MTGFREDQVEEAGIETLKELWAVQGEQLKLNDEQLESAFAQVERMTRTSVESLNEQLNRVDNTVANIVTHLRGANTDLADAVEGLDETMSKMTGTGGR